MDFTELFGDKVAFIYGPSGAGKTVLVSKAAFEFAREGRRVLWVSFNESRDRLTQTWKAFGWNPDAILIYDYPFVPQYRETLFNQVIDLAYKEKADVFILDGIDVIVTDGASADALTKMALYSVIGIEAHYNPLGDIADVILRLKAKYTDTATIRRVEVQKARGLAVDSPVFYMAILPNGPHLLTPSETMPADIKTVPVPGMLRGHIGEVYLGTQIAIYGATQKAAAELVDDPAAVAYVHKPHQLHFFKKAKARVVPLAEHKKLEFYAQRILTKYVITLDAEKIPRWFKKFRQHNAVWIDIYTSPPLHLDYDYVLYTDGQRIKLEQAPELK